MLRNVNVRFAAPEGCADPFNWVVGELAAKAGIANVELLRQALIKGLAEIETYSRGGGMVRADGRVAPVAVETAAAKDRIVGLLAQLDAELAGCQWPLDGTARDDLMRATAAYRDRLESIAWAAKATRATKKPKAAETMLVVTLASRWPELTGSVPAAWRTNGRTAGRGAFYQFVGDACATFGLRAPKVDTVRAVLHHLGYIDEELKS